MNIDHIGIFTNDPERLKDYYTRYFGGIAGPLYINERRRFRSYFLDFDSGTRLEIMSEEGLESRAGTEGDRHMAGIAHLAFALATKEAVDKKASELAADGYAISGGPRTTGDGYYEFETADPDGNCVEVMVQAPAKV